MKNKFKLNDKLFESENSKITGKEVLLKAGLVPVEDFELLIKVNENGFEPIELTEVTDLHGAGLEGFYAKPYGKLTIYVDEIAIDVDETFLTPNKILAIAGKVVKDFYLVQQDGEVEISYKNDIYPIFKDYCLSCHVPGGKGYDKSGFDLRTYQSLMKGTKFGTVVKPGSSLSSTLNVLVSGHASPAVSMPTASRVDCRTSTE